MNTRYRFILSVLFLFVFLLLPHDSLYARESISLEVQPVTREKIWNSSIPRDQNPHGKTDTYYYPWAGDNSTTVTGFRFVNLTEKKKSLIEKYDITVDCDLEEDIQSASITDMNFLGQRPVSITWNKKPILKIGKEEQAETDGYLFVMKLKDAVCDVIDNGEERITEKDWGTYYEKAKESCNLIFRWQEQEDKTKNKKSAFGSKDNPHYGDGVSDIWSVISAARAGYVPYDDATWFDRWFSNTKAYIEEEGPDQFYAMNSTDVAKIVLAIEATGYDPRDVSGVDLLEIAGRRNGTNMYGEDYAIHSIMAGGYSAGSFDINEMETWAHKRAQSLKNIQDSNLKNADNAIGWQPLVYWYGKEGFEDVTEAIDFAEPRLASIAQRATGAICTEGYEEACPMYGNNAWNDAQALLFAGEFGVNVIRPESGYTKNGNNILDAVFALINYEEGTVPGFYNYDPAQIARGLNSFVREYERDVLGQDTPPFWIFSDVEVPTRPVNDAIIALNGKSTDQDIAAAREAYEALDDTHKAIFNQEYYRKLVYYENGGRDIEAAKDSIMEIPDYAEISFRDKGKILGAREAYDKLSEDQKELIGSDLLDKLNQAEIKLGALEIAERIMDLDRTSTEEEIALIRRDYEGLTENQKGLINEACQILIYYESGGRKVDPVKDLIEAIPDSKELKLTDKGKVTAARTAYETLSDELKALLPASYLEKLLSAEKVIDILEKESSSTIPVVPVVKKGLTFVSGKNRYKIITVSGKKGEISFSGCTNKKLAKVSIPDTVRYQGYTFTVSSVGSKALSGYKKLTTVTIGGKVKTVGASAFKNCGKLKKITIKTNVLKKVGGNALKGIHKKAVIKVPKKKWKVYKKILKGKGQKKTVKIK